MRSLKNIKKPGDFTKSQLVELVEHFGGDDGGVANALSVLNREKRIVLENAAQEYFSSDGLALRSAVSSNHYVDLVCSHFDKMGPVQHQPYINEYWNIFTRRSESFGGCVTLSVFDEMLKELLVLIESKPLLSPILQAPWFPIVIPKYGPKSKNYGLIAEAWSTLFFRVMTSKFPESQVVLDTFTGGLKRISNPCLQSRHQYLYNLLHRRSVVGIYFPVALQGWSAEAATEFVQNLPTGFMLSGAVDTLIAGMTYPESLYSQKKQFYIMAGTDVEERRGRKKVLVASKDHSLISISTTTADKCFPGMSPGLTFIKPWKKWDR